MASIKVVLNKDRIKKSGGYALVIQIIHKRKKRVMNLGYDLTEENFNAKKELVFYSKDTDLSRKKIKEINTKIKTVKENLKKKLATLEMGYSDFTASDIIAPYRGDKNNIYLLTYFQKQINEKIDIGKYGIAEAYKSTFNSIKRFLAGRTVTFDYIDVKFLRDYEHYLISTCVVQNTISYYMRNLRTIYNRAFNDNLILQDHNPFLKYKFHKVTTIKRALKKEVIQRIVNLDLSNNKELEEARDFFMFSFYTRGMSAVDILYLKHSDIVDGVVFYQRHKTQQGLQIAVTDQIQHLLDKYNVDKEYALPFITRYRRPILRDQYKAAYTRLNRHLKKVAVLAGINSPLTSYVARHSWATIAKEGGAPIAAISEGLGHTSEKTTSIYLSYFDRSVIDNINKNVGLFKNNC